MASTSNLFGSAHHKRDVPSWSAVQPRGRWSRNPIGVALLYPYLSRRLRSRVLGIFDYSDVVPARKSSRIATTRYLDVMCRDMVAVLPNCRRLALSKQRNAGCCKLRIGNGCVGIDKEAVYAVYHLTRYAHVVLRATTVG